MRPHFACLALIVLAACQKDETLFGYGAGDKSWQLSRLDGVTAEQKLTLEFHDDGAVRGTGPCNSFGAMQTAPYPWFNLTRMVSTKRACAALAAEHAYFTALMEMSLVEVSGTVMILSDDHGREMVFSAQPTALVDP